MPRAGVRRLLAEDFGQVEAAAGEVVGRAVDALLQHARIDHLRKSLELESDIRIRPMGREEDRRQGKGEEILRQLREDAGSKKHLDQQKIRAAAALRRAIEARDEQAFVEALMSLGIDPDSEAGRTHLLAFHQLGRNR